MTIKTIEEKAIRARNIRNRWRDIGLGKFQEKGEVVATVYLLWALWVHAVVEGTPFSAAFTGVARNTKAHLPLWSAAEWRSGAAPTCVKTVC